jgi:hypothetical protein
MADLWSIDPHGDSEDGKCATRRVYHRSRFDATARTHPRSLPTTVVRSHYVPQSVVGVELIDLASWPAAHSTSSGEQDARRGEGESTMTRMFLV